jgi:hypothetical protein
MVSGGGGYAKTTAGRTKVVEHNERNGMDSANQHRLDAAARPDDVIAAVLEDHADIQSLMNEVSTSLGRERQESFECLVAKLAVHETAEEEVVHPLTKRVAHTGGVIDQRLNEESKGKQALADLEKMGTDAPGFLEKFETLRTDVLRHAENEEQQEHPLLARADEKNLVRAAKAYRAAQKLAPTHPHPHGPDRAVGNLVIGPFMAVADRAPDAVRNAMHHDPIV